MGFIKRWYIVMFITLLSGGSIFGIIVLYAVYPICFFIVLFLMFTALIAYVSKW